MRITGVNIKLFNKGTLRGFADFTFDDQLVVKGFLIREGRNGLFVSMPSEKGSDGEWYDKIYPLSKEVHGELQKAGLDAYHAAGSSPDQDNSTTPTNTEGRRARVDSKGVTPPWANA